MTKKDFFKGLATLLILPGGFLLGAVLAALFVAAMLAGLSVWIAWSAAQWFVQHAFKSFGKTGRSATGSMDSAIGQAAALPEEFSAEHKARAWDAREAAHRKWLQ